LRLVKDSKDALQEDITKDREANAGIALNATKALLAGVVNRCKVDVAARDGENCATNRNVEVGKGRGTGKNVAALRVVVLRARHLLVVGGHDGCRKVPRSDGWQS